MNTGKTVFTQLFDFIPLREFRKCIKRYEVNKRNKKYSCLDQYLSMAFAQLTYRESLRDIEACLSMIKHKQYHKTCGSLISRQNTLK